MKVSDLKKLLADAPDDLEVVVSGSDHSYCKVGKGTGVVKAEAHGRYLGQYWDDVNMQPGSKAVNVFWVDDERY